MNFIKATFIGNQTVRYEAESGELIDYIKRTWTWRNNNPGNIIKNPFAKRHGSIGNAGGFAVFSSVEDGEKALISLLKTNKYQNKTIALLIEDYAPDIQNDTENYKKLVKKFTGLDPDTKVGALKDDEFDNLIAAIKRVEGHQEGKIVPVIKRAILKTKEEKGTIISYLIEDYGWVDKKKAIEFAKKEIIDATIVKGKNGQFLKSRPDQTTTNNLDNKK